MEGFLLGAQSQELVAQATIFVLNSYSGGRTNPCESKTVGAEPIVTSFKNTYDGRLKVRIHHIPASKSTFVGT
jgi:hypothetical protein